MASKKRYLGFITITEKLTLTYFIQQFGLYHA